MAAARGARRRGVRVEKYILDCVDGDDGNEDDVFFWRGMQSLL
jgi:hypothetical protein